jgi:hypothetical protein
MKKEQKLYGRSIVPGLRVTQVEQLHDILLEEIQSGRWTVGQRMPSVSDLARQSGLSRGSVQRALEMLGRESYIHQEDRKGTFLASVFPRKGKAAGTIGVAMMKEDESDGSQANPPFVFQLHWILEMAAERDYVGKVLYLDRGEDWSRIDRTDGPFGSEVRGILTPYPFHHPEAGELPPGRIPLVFAGPHAIDSLPFACGDTWHGAYHLTRKAIAAGHRGIIACCRPGELEIETQLFLEGHRQAMSEAGLAIDEEAIAHSREMPNGDLPAIRQYLRTFREATCVISSWHLRSRDLVAVCDVLGLRVPEDLSIVSRDSSPMRVQDPGKTFTCFEYRTCAAVRAAFDLLEELIEKRSCRYSRVMIPPVLRDGDSLCPPRSGPLFTAVDT